MATSTGLGNNPIVAFVATTNPERAKAFFGGTLGLRLLSEELPFALVFDAGGTMLRVTIVKDVSPAHHTVLGWATRDIEATVRELETAGVTFFRLPFMNPEGPPIWDAPGGARVAWFKDPDGNTLSVSQHP